MSAFAVQEETALGLIRFQLSGFRGYPPSKIGEKVFARAVSEQTISVKHAEAVLKQFDERFPTLREIIDTAQNLKPQFEPTESQKQKWEREYGKPVPFDTSMEGTCLCCGRPWAEILAHTAVEEEMWRRIKERLKVSDFHEVSWLAVYQAKKALGYPLTTAERNVLAGEA